VPRKLGLDAKSLQVSEELTQKLTWATFFWLSSDSAGNLLFLVPLCRSSPSKSLIDNLTIIQAFTTTSY
jgi:hypothetical protein